MSKLTEILWAMADENIAVAAASQNSANQGYFARKARLEEDQLRAKYGLRLRTALARRCSRIVRKHSLCWHVSVDVYPLHDHVAKTSTPLITAVWSGRHGRVELKCYASSPDKIEAFLKSFETVVAACKPLA